ncbi:MAG: cyclase family protein [Candidatus Helarchaeota archaeon]|nr:cyclase family protein [Candidatus Helarchaeota archaeon]
MKLVDLTVIIEHNSKSEPFPAKITLHDHKSSAKNYGAMGGFDGPTAFPESKALAHEEITLITHCGTHLDAPFHFGDLSEGKPAKTIEQIPLDWCYGDGVVLDFSWKKDRTEITLDDVKKELERIEYKLKKGDIVFIRTGRDKLYRKSRYFSAHPAITREALEWILKFGIKIVGTDAYGFDLPFDLMFNKYKETKDNSHLWPNHFTGRDIEYLHIEKLANLEKLPPFGFKVAAFPIPIKGATAGWVRVVAFLD